MIILPPLATGLLTVRVLLMIALHLRPSPYNPVRHAFSDYAVGPTRGLAVWASATNAACWTVLAVTVQVSTAATGEWAYRTTATVLLGVLAVLSVAVIAAPTDLEGEERTRRGWLHYALAAATFAIAFSLTGDLSRWAASLGPATLTIILETLHWVALAGLVGIVAGLLVSRLRVYFGLLERIFLFAIAGFYLTVSIVMLLVR